jgi:hypothetical protein
VSSNLDQGEVYIIMIQWIAKQIWVWGMIMVTSWRSVLLVEETLVPGENHQPAASQWQTLSDNVVSITPKHELDQNSQLETSKRTDKLFYKEHPKSHNYMIKLSFTLNTNLLSPWYRILLIMATKNTEKKV